jgi:uncharacterized protein involved in exopolysaccharide biosynthesis
MGSNRRALERKRAAERKAAADAREVISRAERLVSPSAHKRRIILIRDAVLALAIACVLVGTWELVDWLNSIATSNPDAPAATGLVER